MAEYIEREALLKAVASWRTVVKSLYDSGYDDCINSIEDTVSDAPAADVQPVKHGQWRTHGSLPANQWRCSECKGLVEVAHYCNECYYDFCPNCGAKMDGGAKK